MENYLFYAVEVAGGKLTHPYSAQCDGLWARRHLLMDIINASKSKHAELFTYTKKILCVSYKSCFNISGPYYIKENVLLLNGYRYYKNNRCKGDRATWYCGKPKCKASVMISSDTVVCFKNQHIHAALFNVDDSIINLQQSAYDTAVGIPWSSRLNLQASWTALFSTQYFRHQQP